MSITPEVYAAVMGKYNGTCAHCRSKSGVEIHHRLARHKWRIRKYPLFIDSEKNLIPLCNASSNNCHESKKHLYRITDREAEVFEKELAKEANMLHNNSGDQLNE